MQVLTAAILGMAYTVFFVLERALPLRRLKPRLLARLVVNVVVTAAALMTAAAIVQPVAAATLDFTQRSDFGLMRLAGFSGAVEFVAAFLLLDLSFYY